MHASRIVLASVFVAAAAAALTGAPAHAGGSPGYDIGAATVDRTATTTSTSAGQLVTLGGTYNCTGAGDRTGSLSFQLLRRDQPPTDVYTIEHLSCDGATHRWSATATVPDGRIATGSATFWGAITVCESPDGPCPAKHVEARVVIRPGR